MKTEMISEKSKITPITGKLITNGEMRHIFIEDISLEKLFFQYSDSELSVIILSDNNSFFRKNYSIIKNDTIIVNSIILRDKNGIKYELFLMSKEIQKSENFYDDSNKEYLIIRPNRKYHSAHHLITNYRPSNKFTLNGDEAFSGHKYIRNEVTGGEGNNTIIGGDKNDTLAGGAGDDILIGHASFDALFGQEGDDILIAGEGNDGLAGGAGDDFLDGGDGEDELHGDADALGCFASDGKARGNDKIFGGEGNDLIEGGRNNDYLAGGKGNDLYIFSAFEGINLIVEYSGEENTISINDYFFHDLNFERYSNHLVISSTESHGNNLVIIIKDQYSSNGYKVKNLQTKSYISHDSKYYSSPYQELVNITVRKNINIPEKSLVKLAYLNDFGDFYRTDLPYIFGDEMPDIEKSTGKKLIDVLRTKNTSLQQMYIDNYAYFGENLPDITYIIETMSSFSPKEASQSNAIYSDYYNASIDNIPKYSIAINNQ